VKRYDVTIAPEARSDLFALYDWIAASAGDRRASFYLQRLKKFSYSLGDAPFRGSDRSDIRKGMRVLGFEGRISIVFMILDDTIIILRFFGFGRNWEVDFELDETDQKDKKSPSNKD
jgi:toxin ParE1/3/4